MRIKPTKLINVLLALSMMLGFVQTIPVMAKDITPQATGTTIGFDAPTVATTCETFEINVVVTDVVALTGYHLEMTFDESKLQVLEVENGGLLYDESDRLGLYEPILDEGNTTGRLIWGMAQRGVLGDPTPVTGSGDLLTITFEVLATSGTTDLEIDSTKTMLVDWPDAFEIDYTAGGKATISLASCAPHTLALDEDEVEENKPVGTTVGTLSATDPDGDSLTYSLVDSTNYPDNAAFEIVSDKLNTKAVFNYEVKDIYTIKIRATDEHGANIEKVFTITVTDVNDAPVLNPIGQQSVANTGTLIITPSATDEDFPAPTLVWSLGAGTPTGATIDPTTGAFSWTPGTTTAPGTYTAIICVGDGDATTCETVTITVTDGVSPIMENVSPARGNVYLADGESFVLVIDASDDNLYSLEVDHSFQGTLPEFTVYADKDNPWGDPASAAWAASEGVVLTYDEIKQIWTINFGEDITEDYFIPYGVTFHFVLKDEAGNTWGSMSPTTPENTYAYTLIRDDVAPVMEVVTPERGNVYLAAGENFVLTIDASDTNLYSLEIDHSFQGTLPEFTVYADKNNPWGDPASEALAASQGVVLNYDEDDQIWTIDFGAAITNNYFIPSGVTFHLVLHDKAGNTWGSMSPTSPANTYAYTLIRDDVDPELISVTPPHGTTVKLGIGDTFTLTIKAEDDNLRELEIDHSMETTLPEISVYASETDPYGGDFGLFETAGVTVTYDDGTQTWEIDFGPTVSGMIANNGGIIFYMVLEDMAGNTWGSMSPTTTENTFEYIVSQDLSRPTIASVVAKGATGFSDVTAVGTTLTVEEGYEVSTIEITMSEPVVVAVGTEVTINPQGAVYGTVTAVNGAEITVTPAVGNETASVLGTFTFTVPGGSVEDLHGNAWLNAPISLVVVDEFEVTEIALLSSTTTDFAVTTPVLGTLAGGFSMELDPAGPMWTYFNASSITSTRLLKDGTYPFFIGTDKAFDLIVSENGTTFYLQDGQYPSSPLRVRHDDPLGTYTYVGSVTDVNGFTDDLTIKFTFVAPFEVTEITLLSSKNLDLTESTALIGNLATGFSMALDPTDPSWTYFNVGSIDSTRPLANGVYSFNFANTTQKAFDLMVSEVEGVKTFYLRDGQHLTVPLRISGNDPLGPYTYVGTVADAHGFTDQVTVKINFFDGTGPILSITGATADGEAMGELAGAYVLVTGGSADLNDSHAIQFAADSKSNELLKDEYFGLFLVADTDQKAALKAHIEANTPEPWLAYMLGVVEGTNPWVYIKGNADKSLSLVDGAWRNIMKDTPGYEDHPLTVADNSMLGTFTLQGTVEDVAGNESASVTLSLTVVRGLTVIDAEMKYGTTPTAIDKAVNGNLSAGFVMELDPAVEYYYLDANKITTNNQLKEGMHPFFMDGGSTTDPIFYLNVAADGTKSLIDGWLYKNRSEMSPLRVNGDFVLGDYTYTGTLEDVYGSTVEQEIKFTFVAPLNVSAVALISSENEDLSDSKPVDGSLTAGFTMELNPTDPSFIYFNASSVTSNRVLKNGEYPFYFVVEGVTTSQKAFDLIVEEDEGVKTFYLRDGQYPNVPLRVSGTDPLGVYNYAGTVTDGFGFTDEVTIKFTFVDTKAPSVVSAKAIGAEGFDDVPAIEMVITVDQGYTVEKTEITINEVVTVLDGTVVYLGNEAYGSITLDSTGKILTVTPYPGNEVASLVGEFIFSVPDGSVKDLAGNSLETLSLKLIVLNVAPVAVDDAYTVNEDETLTVAVPGVLANDTDYPGTTLTAILIDEPANGTVVLNADGSFVYTPTADFNGSDSFTYTANDGDLSSTNATVTITVTAVNDKPVAQDQTVTTAEDTAKEITLVATDADGDSLTYTVLAGPTNGALSGTAPNLTYTPNANYVGTDTFTFKANDSTVDSNTATVTITVTPENDAPVAQDQTVTTDEDTAKEITLVATDADSDPLTYTVVGPTNGTLSGTAPNLTYTPNANFHGTDTFTFIVNDGTIDSNTATVSITVTPVNDAPVAVNDTYATSFQKALTVDAVNGVLKNDSDVDGDPMTAILVTNVNNGTLVLAADGSFTYTPNTGFNGVDTFTYTANDGTLDSNIATVSITVSAFANTPPVAVADEYETDENIELVVAAPGVLDNDYDIDGDNLTATLKTNVTNGTLVLLDNGSFTYKPNANFCGTDSFVYTLVSYPSITAGDDGWIADATATITVYCDAKISSSDLDGPFYVGNLQEFHVRLENPAPGHVYGSLAASIFVDGITAADFSSVEVLHPVYDTWVPLTPDVDGSGMRINLGPIATIPLTSGFDQTLSFRVNFNTPGKYPVTGTLYDGAIDPTKVIATYSDTMVVAGLLAQDFGYMYQSGVLGVTAGFGNVNFDLSQATEIKVELFTGPDTAYVLMQTNKAVSPTAMASWTQFSTPFDIFGTFDYSADGYWTNTRAAEYGQTAIPSRVLATITLPGGITLTAENTILTGERGYILDTLDEELESAPDNYDPAYTPVGDIDFDINSNTYTGTYTAPQVLAGGPMNDMARYLGALYRQPGSTITSIVYNGRSYTWDTTGTLTGSNWEDSTGKTLVSQVTDDFQAAIAANSWDPDAGFVMTVHDDYNHSATVTFKLIILNTLDDELESAPSYVYSDYSYVGNWAFDDPTNVYTLTYDDTNYAPGAMYDLARYLGALYRQAGSTVATITYDGTTYTWDPNGTLEGSNWVDADGTTLVSVITADVLAEKIDPETGLILTLSDVFHTENVTFKLVINDTIAPILESVLPTKGSSFLYGPGGKFVLTVDAKDDNLYSLEVDHSMQYTLPEFTVYASVANPYGDEATKALFEAQGVFVTYNATTQTWTIDFGAAITTQFAGNGGITFHLVLADESGNKWGSMSPTTPENTFNYIITQDLVAPTVSGATAIGADGFANVNAIDMVITVYQGYTVAKTEISMNEVVTLIDGTVVYLGNEAYGSISLDSTGKILTVTPNPGNEVASVVGEFIFTIPDGSVKDLAGNALETLSLKLIVLNVAPVADDDAYTVYEDETLTVAVPGVLANDTDYPGTTLTAELVSGPAKGTLTLNANGSFVYIPEANFHGTDTFTYTANDGDLSSTAATVTITVTAVNDAPVAQDQTVTTAEDTAKAITLVATDADGDTLTYTVVAGPTNGTLSGTAPNLTYTPNANFTGSDSFTFKANDVTIDSNTATVSITVTPENDAPVAQDQTVTTDEDTAITINLVATDVDNTTLTYEIVDEPTHGSLSTLSGNQVVYTPSKDYNGTDSFTFKANDGSVDSNTATVTINITPVNDAPVALDDSYTMVEDETLSIASPGVLANDLDDGSSLTAVLVDDVSYGELTLNEDGSFTYTPDAHFNGKDSFTYKASDGELLSNLAVVEITVTPVNDWVIANDDAYDTLMNVNLVVEADEGILVNDVLLDPNETVSIDILRAPESGTLVMNNDGSFTYVPKEGFWGTVTFEYRVRSEQKAGEYYDDATVTILVKPHGLIYFPIIFR